MAIASCLLTRTNEVFRNGKYRGNCSHIYDTLTVTYVLNAFARTSHNFPYTPQENSLVTCNQSTYIQYCFSTYDNRKVKILLREDRNSLLVVTNRQLSCIFYILQ
jgi:hypothetical protein